MSNENTATAVEKKWTWNTTDRAYREAAYDQTREAIETQLTENGRENVVTTVTTVLRSLNENAEAVGEYYETLQSTNRRLVVRKVLADLVRETGGSVTKEASTFRSGKRGSVDTYRINFA